MSNPRMVIGVDIPDDHLQRLRDAFPEVEFEVCSDSERLPDVVPGAVALLGWRAAPEVIQAATDLRWLHSFGVGVDRILTPELVDSEIVVTNNSGIRSSNMAEHILAMMLGFARGLPEILRYQVRHEWHHADRGVFEIGGQTLGVVGLGSIGQALARRANALDMRVLGLRRRGGEPPEGVERVYLREELHDMLRECDHVAICLPLTPDTRHMFGAAEFAAMKETAYLYNVGRGAIVDQDALVDALRNEQIGGAGLDVTDPEPLPEESPLWDMVNVQITCHTSGATPHNWHRGTELLIDNIGRFLRDEPLLNVVDKRAGY